MSATPMSATPSEMLRDAVEGAGFTIEGLPEDATREQVLDLAGKLLQKINESTPISPLAVKALGGFLDVINRERGTAHTVDTLAKACGVDLATATRADEDVMSAHVAGVLMA